MFNSQHSQQNKEIALLVKAPNFHVESDKPTMGTLMNEEGKLFASPKDGMENPKTTFFTTEHPVDEHFVENDALTSEITEANLL